MFKGFKVVSVVCGVVACKDNSKVDRCGVVGAGICDDNRLVCGCGG